MKESIVDFYLKHVRESHERYGEKVIVFLESGHFMELYDHVSEEKSYHLRICAELLNIIVTRRDKSDPKSDFMAGIPTISIKRYQNLLLRHSYTVVMITQTNPPPDCQRKITQILSPSCVPDATMEDMECGDLISMFMEYVTEQESYCHITQYQCRTGDITFHTLVLKDYSEMLLFIKKYRCSELLILYEKSKECFIDMDEIQSLYVPSRQMFHLHPIDEKTFRLLSTRTYQETYLSTTYSHLRSQFDSIYETLNIKYMETCGIVNFIHVLEFIKHHDEHLIQALPKPQWAPSSDPSQSTKSLFLTLHNNTLSSLDVFSDQKEKCLFFYLDHTKTKNGSHQLRNDLLYPLTDPVQIEERYAIIDYLKESIIYNWFDSHFTMKVDVSHLHRKYALGSIPLPQFHKLYTYDRELMLFLKELYSLHPLPPFSSMPLEESIVLFEKYIREVSMTFDFESVEIFYLQGLDSTLDALRTMMDEIKEKIEMETRELQTLFAKVQVKYSEKDGHSWEINRPKNKPISEILQKIQSWRSDCEIDHQSSKSVVKVKTSSLLSKSSSFINYQAEFFERQSVLYKQKLHEWNETYIIPVVKPLYQFLTRFDVSWNATYIAKQYRYVRPVIDTTKDHSCLQVERIRHPIIERLLEKKERAYVTNDFICPHGHGYILYGVNSVGKSSFMKSIAINLLMAQAGMFVACSSFVYYPYQRLFMRNGTSDDLFNHHSSFVKEMCETRDIVDYANDNSLVLVDELCASTEITSATKIVTSVLKILYERQSSFIFSTHIQHLHKEKILLDLPRLHCIHLKVRLEGGNKLFFDRTISNGSPSISNYGLHVAKHILSNPEFNRYCSPNATAFEFPKTSHYNRSLLMDKCAICDYKPSQPYDLPLDCHHINMQCLADKEGYHEEIHKNHLQNLVVLCKICHQKTHQNLIHITGYVETLEGRELLFERF